MFNPEDMGIHNKVEPINAADNFFGIPEVHHSMSGHAPNKCWSGCLALRVPEPPQYAPPAICNISKDGRIAATGGRDVELYLWNTENGDLLSTVRGHDICWTTSYDCTFYVTVQEDSKVYLWDQATCKQRQLLGHPEEPLVCCSVSLDDEYIVVGGEKGGVFSWDSDSGVEYRQYEGGHKGQVSTVMCYPMEDGTHIIISCGATDHTVVVWDLETVNKRVSILINELEAAKNVKYHISKDGTQVLAWCSDSVPFPNLVFVDALNDSKNSVFCHDGLVRHAVFAKDSAKIISCGADGKIVVWDTVTLEPMMAMTGHSGTVLCCAINEEGTHIVSCGEDCTVRLWSAEDGRQLQSMEAQDEPIKMCTFDKAFTKILACDTTGRVYVWSTLSEVILNLLRRFSDTISAVAMTPDQKLMAAGCNNGRVMMWDVERRELIWEHSLHAGQRVEAITFNSLTDMASAGADGRISLVSVDTGKQINFFLGQDEPIVSLAFSPDDERIAGCSADGKILLYMTNNQNRKAKLVLRSNISRVTSFVWSPNSKVISGCCADGCVLVWNASTGSIFTVLEGDSAATCCAFDYVGKLMAVGTFMGTTVIYNIESSELLCELRTNASPVRSVVFNSDTTKLTTVCSRQAIVWDVETNMKLRTFDFVVDMTGEFRTKPHPYRSTVAHSGTILFDPESETVVYDMASVEDKTLRSYYLSDTRFISSGLNRGVIVWSAAGTAAPDKFHTTHDAITSCHFSYDDRLVAMGTQDGNIVVYDVVHSETVEVIAAHQNGPCRCVRLSPNNNEILSAGADAKVIMWDWRKRTPTRIYSGHFISVGCCDLAHQGTRVVSGDNHGMISVWEKETGHVVQAMPLAHAKAVLSVSMAADGLTIASVGADCKVAIWHVDMGIELVSLTAAFESSPLYCSFSPDGNKLAVTETNGNIMIWNAMVGCQWYMISPAHKGKVTGCSWSSDCRRLVTCGHDSIMAIWDSESGATLHKFNVKAGPLTCVAVSPSGLFVAGGSTGGTLSVVNVPLATREVPEPSFLYNWLSGLEPQAALVQYVKLAAQHATIANVQDAQGWSIINHAMSKGNAGVAGMVLNTLPDGAGSFGLISAVPFAIKTRVKFHAPESEGDPEAGMGVNQGHTSFNVSGPSMRGRSVSARAKSFSSGGGSGKQDVQASSESMMRDALVQKSIKSFSQQIKKVAVELFTEKREVDHMELIMNNALALALNSKSSECVQVILDAAAAEKVSWGSYHAITDMMPSLAVRYPYMCYGFLANLKLQKVGELEVPVNVMRGLDKSVIRTAPFFTNVRALWQSHLKLHEVKSGPQPYAHVEASMVRLPFACALGRESLLQTLVVSKVPVQTFATPTVRAVIKHKWNLYGGQRLTVRAINYLIYTLIYTTFCVIYATENRYLNVGDYWNSGSTARAQLLMDAYLFVQAAWFGWMEVSQVWAIGPVQYCKSPWNLLDVTSISLMLAIPPLHVARVSALAGQALSPIIAVEIILVYLKIFFYGLAFEPTGPLVHMTAQITWLIKNWVVLLFLSVMSFGTSLMVLYQYSMQTSMEDYTTFGIMLLTMWKMVIGANYSLDVMLTTNSWRVLSLVIFSLFMFVVQILLLNILIALIRDIYEKVSATEEDVFLKGRAQLIVEVETLMGKAQLMEYALMPPYVHLLTTVKRDVHRGASIEGRLDRLELMAREQAEAMANLARLLAPTMGIRMFGGGAGGAGGVAGGNGQHGIGGAGGDAHAHADGVMGSGHMGGGGGPSGMMMVPGPDGQMVMVPADPNLLAMYGAAGNGGGMVMDPITGAMVPSADQASMLQMNAQRLKESESQLPAILRQIDRLQRTVNNQEMRMEGMVMVLRDIENLLRNQQPVIVTQEAAPPRRNGVLSEAELEKEVKRLLGKGESTKL